MNPFIDFYQDLKREFKEALNQKVKAGSKLYHGTDDIGKKFIPKTGFVPSEFGWLGKGVYY